MIAIKDMEMPKSCKDCPMVYSDIPTDCYWCNLGANECKSFDDGTIKLPDCPLIEIEQSEDCVSRQAVRTCKDCKHRPQGLYCNRLDKFTNDSFYCADCEKRGGENGI
jgi:hypothetical protein